MKPIHFPSLERLHTNRTIPLIVAVLLFAAGLLLAQEGVGTQEIEAQRIYRQVYQAAMADSVISAEEEQ
ncbi:MAG: hypothetical protein ACETWG_00625, partial [Candidatus Neomarinimicrobiota bacterium]